ncbi:MATE family efflux transporter [Parabacteroides sp. Marseille-P3160]|uniref:MATE family efflux transporter n=1 Tax=Parabacteroides sp. Marseille-P3160 TaxID=1917887 RepID=UPI0009BBFF5E|nr:MATE family efflux transporter [Parabacteroides sp. Marseille-P3160]
MYTNKQIWNVSYPIFLSLLAQNIINITNTAFLGRVGEVELGASALGGLYYICAFTIAFGFSIGSQIVIARRNGEGNYQAVGPVMIQGIFFLLILAAFIFSISRLYGHQIMGLMISSDAILHKTVEYLDIRVFGFFFSFVNVMFRSLFVGITRTKVLTLNAIVMAITNIILDYLLIFGNAGLPEMGIQGAAIASVAAEAVSILFFVLYTYFTVDRRKYALNKIRSFSFKLLRHVLGISIFTMFQYFISMSTFFLFFIAVEHIGQRELAIANIVRSVYIVLFIPINALSTTTNSFVSNAIGAGKINEVLPTIRKIAKISFLIMSFCAIAITLFPQLVLSVYTNDPSLLADSVPSIYVIAIAIILSSVGSIFFSGISGTGNTRSAFILELLTLSIYCTHLYIFAIHMKQPVEICFTTEIVYFGILLITSALYLKYADWQKKKI